MPLAPGTNLGAYEVVEPLGQGGMGEVYRARDTRLERTVAIKILPVHLSKDPVRKQRFEREAKTISALNHPNICTIHDIGSQDSVDYLVMECVEGESLAHRLERGPLSVEQVLKTGREIADALDKAHRSGIIHRDVKPGNIMLTKSGSKLLDFGLARPSSKAASVATLSAAAPQRAPLTEEGVVVGTFQYMSPEQVEGKELDARSDIFSLGAVLYEMLTGQRAFEGKSQLSVASAILEKEPAPIGAIKPLAPRSLDHVIRRCLAKSPDDRWQTARDVALELTPVTQSDSAAQPIAKGTKRRARHLTERLAWALLAILLLVATVHFFIRSRVNVEQSQQLFRTSIPFPDLHRAVWGSNGAISPDGHLLVFAAVAPDGKQQLWLRPLDSSVARPIPGTEDGERPFWSPDSRWIAFYSGGKLKRTSVEGGAPLEICSSTFGNGGSWGTDGTILFGPSFGSPLHSVPAAGGTPKPVTQLDKSLQEVTHRWPAFLPDGKHFIFFSGSPVNAIYAGSLDSTERKLIVKNNSNALYAPPGYLLFVRNGILMAQAFDASRLELSGDALPIAEDVPVEGVTQRGLFSASANGILAIGPRQGPLVQPVWVDRSGKVQEAVGEPAMYSSLALSPDGQKVAFTITDPQEGSVNIWLYSTTGHQKTRLTFESTSASSPVWSPDGKRIIFAARRQGIQILGVPTTGVGQAELFLPSDPSSLPDSWSTDGRYVALGRSNVGVSHNWNIWILPMWGEKKPYRLFNTDNFEVGASFSPSGKWLAYLSNETGRFDIYIVPFPDANLRLAVSSGGPSLASFPRWSPDGRELYYLTEGGTLMSATLVPGKNGLQVTGTRPLFKTTSENFDVSRDGKRFLILKDAENQPPPAITIIQNWTKALQK